MSNKNRSSESAKKDSRAAKKAVVLGTRKKVRFLLAAGLAFVGLLAGSGMYVLAQKPGGQAPLTTASAAQVSDPAVVYPAALFDNGKARFYSYKAEDGITVKYFVLKSSDGVVRAAFDACDVCWRAGKGYHQEGDTMVCGNCGRKFASVRVNEVKGGCNPAPLPRSVEDGKVILKIADILEGKPYFDLSAGGGRK